MLDGFINLMAQSVLLMAAACPSAPLGPTCTVPLFVCLANMLFRVVFLGLPMAQFNAAAAAAAAAAFPTTPLVMPIDQRAQEGRSHSFGAGCN